MCYCFVKKLKRNEKLFTQFFHDDSKVFKEDLEFQDQNSSNYSE